MALFRKRKATEYYDLHCHILPGMDDGSPDAETSIAMLREMARQGCRGLIATSHYYNDESIGSFLSRRAESFDRLQEAIAAEDADFQKSWQGRIGLGAEAAFYQGLSTNSGLTRLCFRNPAKTEEESSHYILIEMPFCQWTPGTLRELRNMINVRGLHVIIAHLERFPAYTSEDSIRQLMDLDLLIQMNTGCLLHRSTRKPGLQMVRNGITQVMGTDSHHIDYRKPNMADGLQVLKKAGLGQEGKEILQRNEQIFRSVME